MANKTKGQTQVKPMKEVVTIDKPTRSEDFVNLFVNNVRFGYTKFDIQMICARSTVSLDPINSGIEEIAVITFTPAHAKAVLQALENNLKIYEDQYGEIIMPDDREERK